MAKFLKKRRIKANESILDTEKFMYHEDTEANAVQKPSVESENAVDYIILPRPENGKWAAGCALAGAGFLAATIITLFRAEGKPSQLAAVFELCGLLWSVLAIFFSVKGMGETDRNYRICYLAGGAGMLQITVFIMSLILTR